MTFPGARASRPHPFVAPFDQSASGGCQPPDSYCSSRPQQPALPNPIAQLMIPDERIEITYRPSTKAMIRHVKWFCISALVESVLFYMMLTGNFPLPLWLEAMFLISSLFILGLTGFMAALVYKHCLAIDSQGIVVSGLLGERSIRFSEIKSADVILPFAARIVLQGDSGKTIHVIVLNWFGKQDQTELVDFFQNLLPASSPAAICGAKIFFARDLTCPSAGEQFVQFDRCY